MTNGLKEKMTVIKIVEEMIQDKGYDIAYNNNFLINYEEKKSIADIPKELHSNILM